VLLAGLGGGVFVLLCGLVLWAVSLIGEPAKEPPPVAQRPEPIAKVPEGSSAEHPAENGHGGPKGIGAQDPPPATPKTPDTHPPPSPTKRPTPPTRPLPPVKNEPPQAAAGPPEKEEPKKEAPVPMKEEPAKPHEPPRWQGPPLEAETAAAVVPLAEPPHPLGE